MHTTIAREIQPCIYRKQEAGQTDYLLTGGHDQLMGFKERLDGGHNLISGGGYLYTKALSWSLSHFVTFPS